MALEYFPFELIIRPRRLLRVYNNVISIRFIRVYTIIIIIIIWDALYCNDTDIICRYHRVYLPWYIELASPGFKFIKKILFFRFWVFNVIITF